jgi:hypothetical protein
MTLPVDVAQLPPAVQRLLDPKTPAPMRQMAARGIAPGLRPADSLTVIVLLAEDADAALAATAEASLNQLPTPLLNGALAQGLPPGVIDRIAPKYATQPAMMEKFLALAAIAASTVAEIAGLANEAVAELVATNEERLLANPAIIEKLYMNKATRMSTADRIVELAVRNGLELKGIPAYKEVALAISGELIAEPTPEPTYDDLLFREVETVAQELTLDVLTEDTHRFDEETGEEVVTPKFLPLHARLGQMTISQRIRVAMLGSAAERGLLVRDSNKLVATAAIRSPLVQDNEVVRISASRAVCDDVLRVIGLNKDWLRNHQIKLNLVSNPRTPFYLSSKLITHLRDHELKAVAKSKNVTGAIATAARQQLQRKGQT